MQTRTNVHTRIHFYYMLATRARIQHIQRRQNWHLDLKIHDVLSFGERASGCDLHNRSGLQDSHAEILVLVAYCIIMAGGTIQHFSSRNMSRNGSAARPEKNETASCSITARKNLAFQEP